MDSFPNLNINVKDASAYTPINSEILPLHRPIYVMKTEKGPIGEPVWCSNYTRAVEVFGEKAFDRLNKDYFSRSSVFLLNSFPNNGAFIVRIGNNTVLTANMVLKVQVPLTTAGSYVYSIVPMDDTYTVSTQPITAATGEAGAIYPIMAFTAKDAGVYGNEYGIRVFGNTSVATYSEITKLNSFIYSFGFVKKDSDTYTRIKTKYSPYEFNFAGTEGTVDPVTLLTVDFDNVFERYFGVNYPAPINTHVYGANISTVAKHATDMFLAASIQDVKDALTDADDVVQSDRLNILTMKVTLDDGTLASLGAAATPLIPEVPAVIGTGTEQNPEFPAVPAVPAANAVYATVTGGLVFNSTTPHYLEDGSDGDTDISGKQLDSNETDVTAELGDGTYKDIEAMISKFYTLDLNAKITDAPRYPFNTIVDTGYSIGLKHDMIDMLAIRDDVKVVMVTWVGSGGEQDEAEANSVGASLVDYIRLTPESELFGTGCFRAIVFGQTGVLNGETYKKTVPFSIWYTTKLAEYHNLQYIAKNPCGLPYSEVSMFKSINWKPSDKIAKRSMWDACINYCQHYDMTHLHFAGLKSVYQYDTSVLSTDSFSNMLIYVKQLVRPIWAKYAGVEDVNLAAVYSQVLFDLNTKLAFVLNGKYSFVTSMYQTEEEALIGFVHHVNIEITGGPSQRVWNVDIICKRTGFGG